MKKILVLMCLIVGVVLPVTSVAALSVHHMQAAPDQSFASTTSLRQLETKARLAWPWYVTRAAGLVAAALLMLLILSGIGLVTGYTYRVLEPLNAWAMHRALGIAFGVSVLIHVTVLLFDKYVPFNLLQVFIPFKSHYTPAVIGGVHLGSAYVAAGILAFYASMIIVVSSLFWIDKKPTFWRLLHYLGYLLVVLVFIHGLYLGTDIKQGALRVLWWIVGIVIFIGIISRMRRARTLGNHHTDI